MGCGGTPLTDQPLHGLYYLHSYSAQHQWSRDGVVQSVLSPFTSITNQEHGPQTHPQAILMGALHS